MVPPKPPRMKNRVIRVGDKVWDAAMAKAAEREESLGAVIREALVKYAQQDEDDQRPIEDSPGRGEQ